MNNHIYLIHGYTANPSANWFPWLKKEVNEKLNQGINLLEMPNSNNPIPEEWDAVCDEKIAHKDGIVIIGHSLGCIEALRFVSQHNVHNVNLILVSGFDETTYTLPQLAPFTCNPIDYTKVLPKVKDAVVISAIDDDIIPYTYSETLARHLHCKFIVMPTGKHFIDRDNIYTLPVVYNEICSMLKPQIGM
ncbi:alpha/beta hydrolase [Oscillospiraceae bacterium MB08-C2-2]|nr:alpha/beta hydrolase [Oscillospiraceae bacterium MB08-C2-2]